MGLVNGSLSLVSNYVVISHNSGFKIIHRYAPPYIFSKEKKKVVLSAKVSNEVKFF